MVGGISQGAGSSLYDMLRSLQKEQEDILNASAAETLTPQAIEAAISQAASSHAEPSNMMSRNFASAEREQSRYIEATRIGMKASQKVNSQQQNALTSIMQQAKMEYENAATAGERYIALKRAEKKISWHQSDEVRKLAEETHLKESKEDLEKRAQEATAPKDENAGEAAPMPEISDPAPAPEASAEPAPAPEVSAAPAPAPEVSAPAAPSTPSIDIVV
jgi:Predicted membrane protein